MGDSQEIQSFCQQGQALLEGNEYLAAESVLVKAEQLTRLAEDWITLSRLYMPLQEARRQRRLRCAEGASLLDLITTHPDQPIDPRAILDAHPQGQFLIAGYGTLAPAARFRELSQSAGCYADTFLAAAYPILGGATAVVIAPTANTGLPPADTYTIDGLLGLLPPHVILLNAADLPPSGDTSPATLAWVQSLWERLHLPFLAMADSTQHPVHKIDAYRQVLTVDYACELAHQRLSDTARKAKSSIPGR